MTLYERMAVTALRRWWWDRTKLRSGQTTLYKRTGWSKRALRAVDARLVRVIDFERALGTLTAQDQTLLLLVYKDSISVRTLAEQANECERTIWTRIRDARWRLYDVLDRQGLL